MSNALKQKIMQLRVAKILCDNSGNNLVLIFLARSEIRKRITTIGKKGSSNEYLNLTASSCRRS
jgi:hypothetical protein